MENHWILEKTAAGTEEMTVRSGGLSRRQRALLIMIDGRTAVGDLCHTATALGESRETLASLIGLGLVQRRSGDREETTPRAAPRVRPDTPASDRPAPRSARRRSLALARLYLMNAMEQALRHDDDPVRERLRGATSRAELIEAFAHCRTIAEEIGMTHAAAIERRFMDLLPDDTAA